MPHWKSEQLQQLLEEREPQQVFGQAVKLAQALDMEFLGLTLHLHIAARGPQIVLYNNYPSAWNTLYQAEDFINIDPTVSKCHHTTLPLVWNDDLFHEVPQLREAASVYGIIHGWSQSVHDQQHNESMVTPFFAILFIRWNGWLASIYPASIGLVSR
ncbi:autoinducer binding domain-containing protein, partial [Pseudomonas soli]|uniref:autoinducer binding domain-containing protein n=1 Tax=Pseudomonas soli TaxID=1306993 RepID=UPI003CFD48D7